MTFFELFETGSGFGCGVGRRLDVLSDECPQVRVGVCVRGFGGCIVGVAPGELGYILWWRGRGLGRVMELFEVLEIG